MKGKTDTYVCKVPKGKSRKGCGGGAKVEELEQTVKRLHKRIAKIERTHKAKK